MMLTEIEKAAIVLMCELESCVSIGVPLTTNAINALDNLKKVIVREENKVAQDLENMYKQYINNVAIKPTVQE